MGSFKVFKNGTIISDPCKIIRGESAWDEFCQQSQKLRSRGRMHRWIPFSFRGYEMKLYYTGGGGLYFGVEEFDDMDGHRHQLDSALYFIACADAS
jgi:hypothetical protein